MFRAEDYVKVDSLSEAYELCQKRSSLVVGGMVWLKMTCVTKRTIVDLSGLGLDKIQETKEEFRIGAMCTLRQLETDQGLNQYFGGIFKECTRHIVGVQMRNLATVGGSIYSRFGFSDILPCLMYAGYTITAVTRINNLAQRYDGGCEFPEVIITNYDPGELERTKPQQLHLFALCGEEEDDYYEVVWR